MENKIHEYPHAYCIHILEDGEHYMHTVWYYPRQDRVFYEISSSFMGKQYSKEEFQRLYECVNDAFTTMQFKIEELKKDNSQRICEGCNVTFDKEDDNIPLHRVEVEPEGIIEVCEECYEEMKKNG